MTEEKIHGSLDTMLTNPKSKNFINHLVRAYMPETNVKTIKSKLDTPVKCVLTGVVLISHEEIDELYASNEIKTKFDNLTSKTREEQIAEFMKVVAGDKEEGVTGKDTTTFMSHNAYQAFSNWVITKSLKGDKHINWLLGSIRRSSFLERAEKIKDNEVQKKVSDYKKKNVPKPSSFTLGESSDIWAKLKANMDS